MTWRHVAGLVAALALPVICGLSVTCSAASLKDVIGLSLVVAGGILGNANANSNGKAPSP